MKDRSYLLMYHCRAWINIKKFYSFYRVILSARIKFINSYLWLRKVSPLSYRVILSDKNYAMSSYRQVRIKDKIKKKGKFGKFYIRYSPRRNLHLQIFK